MEEVITLVTTRLRILIKAASKIQGPKDNDWGVVSGSETQVLLGALSSVYSCVKSATDNSSTQSRGQTLVSHPGPSVLRDQCVRLLIECRDAPLPPMAHLSAVACLDIILQAQLSSTSLKNRSEPGGEVVQIVEPPSSADRVVRSLLEKKLEGRIMSQDGCCGTGERDGATCF